MHHIPDPDRQPQFYEGVAAKRLLAWLIDTAIVAALVAVFTLLSFFAALFFLPLLFAVLNFIYRVVTLAGGSATLGMRFVGIEFRTTDGARFDGGMAVLHTACFYLSCLIPVVQLVSVVMMLISARGQGLSDMVLNTVALNRRAS